MTWLNRVFYVYMAGCVAYLTYTSQYELALAFAGVAFWQMGRDAK